MSALPLAEKVLRKKNTSEQPVPLRRFARLAVHECTVPCSVPLCRWSPGLRGVFRGGKMRKFAPSRGPQVSLRWGYVSGHRCLHLPRRNSCEARQEDEIGVCSRQILRRTKEAKLPRSRPGSSCPGLHRKESDNGKERIEKRHSIQSRIDLPVLENLGEGGAEPDEPKPGLTGAAER